MPDDRPGGMDDSPHTGSIDSREAITKLIETGAMRLCPRCQHIPADHDEVIFQPLGIERRVVRIDSNAELQAVNVTMTVLTLVCTNCGHLIEHCLEYLKLRSELDNWEDFIHVGLGSDPEYDVLEDVARIFM